MKSVRWYRGNYEWAHGSLRPSLQLSSFESRKAPKQLFIFQIGTLNPHGINESSLFNVCILLYSFPTYKHTRNPQFFHSLWRRASARKSAFKLFAVANLHYQLTWWSQNYLVILPHRRGTTVSLETDPLYQMINSMVSAGHLGQLPTKYHSQLRRWWYECWTPMIFNFH